MLIMPLRIMQIPKILTHTRFLLTLRSEEGLYRSLLLFRLSTGEAKYDRNPSGQETDSNSEYVDNTSYASIGEQLYVMESACPHLGADLSHADIEECETGLVAVCPWHRYVRTLGWYDFAKLGDESKDMTSTSVQARATQASKPAPTKSNFAPHPERQKGLYQILSGLSHPSKGQNGDWSNLDRYPKVIICDRHIKTIAFAHTASYCNGLG